MTSSYGGIPNLFQFSVNFRRVLCTGVVGLLSLMTLLGHPNDPDEVPGLSSLFDVNDVELIDVNDVNDVKFIDCSFAFLSDRSLLSFLLCHRFFLSSLALSLVFWSFL